MRRPVKFRILYLATAILSYWLGSQILPETVTAFSGDWTLLIADSGWQIVLGVSSWYFVLLPSLYWFWVIKIGKQAKWKLLIALSLSSLVARFTYPESLVQYFEFITWLRYPIIAVFLVLELYLIGMIVRSLWQARSLAGDPRIHMVAKFDSEQARDLDSKESRKMDLALALAHEPAGWYYAIPRFSRNHVPTIANINLLSAKFIHFLMFMLITIGATGLSFWLLESWSELAAILVSTIIFYCVIMFIASYRVSRYHSLYVIDNKLVINKAWWGFCVLDLSNIDGVEIGEWDKADNQEQIFVGRGMANVKIHLTTPQLYFSSMAMVKEEISCIYLSVDDPKAVVTALGQSNDITEAA